MVMALAALTPDQALQRLQNSLGVRPSTEVDSLLACLLRSGAARFAPCTPRRLKGQVLQAILPLLGGSATSLPERLGEVYEDLLSLGDLIEADAEDAEGRRVLLAAPSFVGTADGRVFVIGGLLTRDDLLSGELQHSLRHHGRMRILDNLLPDDYDALRANGLVELQLEQWLRGPKESSAQALVDEVRGRLNGQGRPGVVSQILLLDSAKSPEYYPGRWVPLRGQTGEFVARRPQTFGADLWCYVRVDSGNLEKLLDFPLSSDQRGCDEAWRLQAAIDFLRGTPQRLRLNNRISSETCVDVFSPVPRWLQRRWDVLGERRTPNGCLISYRMPLETANAEAAYARASLWLRTDEEQGEE
jgi:hypothetical protein